MFWCSICRIISLGFSVSSRISVSRFNKRCFDSSGCSLKLRQPLLRTSILVQEGAEIQELPLIVRKVNDIIVICDGKCKDEATVEKNRRCFETSKEDRVPIMIIQKTEPAPKKKTNARDKFSKQRINIETDEGTAILFGTDLEFLKDADVEQIMKGLNSCYTPERIYSFLESTIAEEVNSQVSLYALKRIVELESNSRDTSKVSKGLEDERLITEVTNRDTILMQLVEMIAKSQGSETVLEGLALLSKDNVSLPRNECRDRLCDEVLVRAVDDTFDLTQLIEVVKILSTFKDYKYQESIDTLWMAIITKEQDIGTNELVSLFKILPCFDRSRKMILLTLERRLVEIWCKLTSSQMGEILNVVYGSVLSPKFFACANKWMSMYMNTATECDLLKLIQSLTTLKYAEPFVEKSLEKYIKSKGTCIKEPAVVAAIMDYCKSLRLRNSYILRGCEEYFLKNAMDLPPSLMSSILVPFGFLDFKPTNDTKFWSLLERALEAKFSKLKMEDALDILLSCIYLKRYPVKFVNEIFKPSFLEKLYNEKDSTFAERLRNKLRSLDVAMTLECDRYKGPMLSLDKSVRSVWMDGRIKQMINQIHSQLALVVGRDDRVSKGVILDQLPVTELYVIDALIHPFSMMSSVFKVNFRKQRNIAVLIHLPEHYCQNTHRLIGPQVMRKRHYRKMGLQVMSLDYRILLKFSTCPTQILTYLSQRFEAVEEAL